LEKQRFLAKIILLRTTLYNSKQRTRLTVDASPVVLGEILSNVDSQGNIHNVAYASRSLSKVEQKYS
jgi:hypothetical protein